MLLNLLADLVLLLHLLFILFVVFGGLLVIHWRRLAWLHIPVVIWGVLLELNQWICPLTPLENYFRRKAGNGSYDTGFIEYYLTAFIYPGWLTPEIQIAMGLGAALLNILIYGYVLSRFRLTRLSSKRNH